jgi:hypothetical protein
LLGRSEAFTAVFRGRLEDFGFEVDGAGLDPAPSESNPEEILIFEVKGEGDAQRLPIPKTGAAESDGPAAARRPFLVYTELDPAGFAPFKEYGLIGLISKDTPDEEVAFFVNKALFYNKVIRRNPRVQMSIPVVLDCEAGMLRTDSTQLSREGMFIRSLNPPEVNSVCTLEFQIPGGRTIKTGARVIYNIMINKDLSIITSPSDPFKRLVMYPGMAVFFTDVPDEDKAAIDTYIDGLV